MLRSRVVRFGLLVLVASSVSVPQAKQASKDVMVAGKLTAGFDMGVSSSGNRTDWLKSEVGYMRMAYPAGQSWGAAFITIGKPKQPPRPTRDLSTYNTLTVEMKGGVGGEQIEIGIKTDTQPDDGSETKVPVKLTKDWKSYALPLGRFAGTDPAKLYIVTEFVFSGGDAVTAFVRNVSFTNSAK